MNVTTIKNDKTKRSLIISFLTLRRAIGYLGVLFPVILVIGAFIFGGYDIQNSISYYYYTSMKNVFVGVLCIIGFILYAYEGYEDADRIAGNFGCVFAIGVALFPMGVNDSATGMDKFIAILHFTSATLFFLTLSYFCLFLFTKGVANPTAKKKLRNKIYRKCGYTMLGCIIAIGTYYFFFKDSFLKDLNPVFWLESLAIVAFGFSWLVKGEALFKDVTS